MEPNIIHLHDKRVEQCIVRISANIACSLELLYNVKEMIANSEDILIKAQSGLEELYLELDNHNKES